MARAARPLAARTYLRRNPRRVLPAVLVQALVTALVLGVVTPLSGFEATSEASLRPLAAFTLAAPMSQRTIDDDLKALLAKDPGLDRWILGKELGLRTPGVVGEGYSLLFAIDRGEQEALLERVGDRLAEGHLPDPDTDGVAMHRDVLRARRMKMGDAFGSLLDPEEFLPGTFRVVGVIEGPARLSVCDLTFASRPTSVLARREPFALVYAKKGRKAASDEYLNEVKDAEGRRAFRVEDEAFWRRRIEKLLHNLPLILDAVVGAITVVIALVVVLLHLIAFQQRADEFALLLAVGHTRRRLVRKIASETAWTAVASLVLGLALGYAWILLYDAYVLAPKAILIDTWAPYPLLLASSLPIVSAIASAAALSLRLRRMDPVSVVQRRNA
jgi:hypothetical protein